MAKQESSFSSLPFLFLDLQSKSKRSQNIITMEISVPCSFFFWLCSAHNSVIDALVQLPVGLSYKKSY